ncbi:unnamed protein product [Schistosoma turkestanicum]|nr:unnamed protein product [Schistosoma turkestanicum]
MSAEFSENPLSDNETIESRHSPVEEIASIQQSASPPLEDRPTRQSTPSYASSTPLQPVTTAPIDTQSETQILEETQPIQPELTEVITDRNKLQQRVDLNSSTNFPSRRPSLDRENSDKTMTNQGDRENNISSNWIPEQQCNVYACSTTTPSSQSVLRLKQYYTSLEESTKLDGAKTTEINNDKNSHNERSLHKIRRNTFDRSLHRSSLKTNGKQAEFSEDFSPLQNEKLHISVEEMRKLFESGFFSDPNRKHRAAETIVTLVKQNEQSNNLNNSKSVEPIKSFPMNVTEYYSRPPKFRTPSPKRFNLPTPPPLPLPPSTEFVDKSYEIYNVTNNNISNTNRLKNKMICKNKNYSSCWSQPAKPILSMSLPYRSRSLAIDKKSDRTYGNRGGSLSRYRACSITQRSLSPIPNTLSFKDNQTNKTAKNYFPKSSDLKCWKFNNCADTNAKNTEFEKQEPNHSIVYCNESDVKPDQIVCMNPSSTDGVYVRSAVVYERVNEKPLSKEPKNFITTYVISKWPSPSQATVQATNLWVAEQSLQQYNQRSSTPHRTQALSKLSTTARPTASKDIQLYQSIPADNPSKLKKTTTQQKDRSLVVQPRIKFDQHDHTRTFTHTRNRSLSPQPLPTPPPTELHPHILRCTSNQCSPSHQSHISQSFMNRSNNPDRMRRSTYHRPYLSRSWSVKSLSPPPPFRSQWLSSMSASRSRQKIFNKSHSLTRDRSLRTNAESFCKQHRGREPNRIINCTKHRSCIESYRMENARRVQNCEKKEWIKRAREISEDRQKYHELRGSWSPPAIRSPPSSTPNNIEERTEREIQKYIKQQSPPARSPRIAIPKCSMYYPQEYVKSLDKGIQCDSVEADENERQIIDQFPNDCIDTTPIAEDFDKKREYFEELIKMNRNLAQCSFCSDCYHCSPGQTPKLSAYSSWDSEINNLNSQNNLFVKRDFYTKHQPSHYQYQRHQKENHNEEYYQQQISHFQKPDLNSAYNSDEHTHKRYQGTKCHYNIYSTDNDNNHYTLSEPQQYASNMYLPVENPAFVEHDTNYPYLDKTLMDQPSINSIKHDYYAKAINAMPKVAPNPPTYSNNDYNRNFYSYQEPYESFVRYRNISPLRVELEDSPNPTSTCNNQYMTERPYTIRKTTHSPPCRFATYTANEHHISNYQQHQKQQVESLESLHCEQNDYAEDQPKFFGRVKQIVQALDKQAAELNSRIDSVESIASPDRHRPLRRSHSDRFSYFMPRTSW